jgi:DNA polymerase III subunit epsilon
MPTFTAIDFETSQPSRWSICQVGLVRVEGGKIKETFNQLVQPPGNEYWSTFTKIHGIDASKTKESPTFDKVWPTIKKHIIGQAVVAHNISFDASCLEQALSYYSLTLPQYERHCTYQLYREKLSSLCEKFKIDLNHHDALSDANACAKLFLSCKHREIAIQPRNCLNN